MKKLIGFVVLIAALLLGCYYGMGVLTERTLKKNIDVLNQSDGVTVVLKSYHRSWFTSDATLDWTLTIPARVIERNGQMIAEPESTYTAQMPLMIHHGPIMVANGQLMFGLGYASSRVDLPAAYLDKFNTLYTPDSVKPSLQLSVYVNYLNDTRLQLIAPKFNLVSKNGNTRFEWLGMSSDVNVSSDRKQIKGHLLIDGLSWVNEHVKGVLSDVRSDYDLHATSTGLYLGDANLYLPSIAVTKDGNNILQVNEFDLHSTTEITKGLFNSSFKAALAKLVVNQKTFSSCSLALSIQRLDAKVLADMNNKMANVQHGTESERQRALLSLLPDVPALLNKGAALKISELRIGLPDGVIKGNVLISLPNENITNPFQLIQKITGDGKLTISSAVLKSALRDSLRQRIQATAQLREAMAQSASSSTEQVTPPAVATPTEVAAPMISAAEVEQQAITQADQKIAELVKAGVILEQGADYVLEFKIAQGQLRINGKEFNPAMLQM